MNIETIIPHLSERRAASLREVVTHLEAAVATGVVANSRFNDAKDIINRAVDEAADKFNDANRERYRAWGFPFTKLIMGAHNLPAALKEANHAVAKRYNIRELAAERAAFLNLLLPLHTLLAQAKPLIAKRGDSRLPPRPKTAEQIADEAARMTCQCCGRAILANLGSIALHGYERPGHGWQTGSCIGAKNLPFEVSRDALGLMIDRWKTQRHDMRNELGHVVNETGPCVLVLRDYSKPTDRRGNRPLVRLEVTRKTFDDVKAANERTFRDNRVGTFEEVRTADIAHRKSQIANISTAITQQQRRYDAWKQTHSGFDRITGKWVAL